MNLARPKVVCNDLGKSISHGAKDSSYWVEYVPEIVVARSLQDDSALVVQLLWAAVKMADFCYQDTGLNLLTPKGRTLQMNVAFPASFQIASMYHRGILWATRRGLNSRFGKERRGFTAY